jgi:hypothetical protein
VPDRREISIDELHRDAIAQAKTISELILELRVIKASADEIAHTLDKDNAIRAERLEATNDRFERIEASIRALREDCAQDIKDIHTQREKFQSRLWIALGALMSAFIGAVSKWVFGGGLGDP